MKTFQQFKEEVKKVPSVKELINEVLDERACSNIPTVEMLDSINITGNIDLN